MIENRNKENLLRTVVRMKKGRRPKTVKEPKEKIDGIPSQNYVDSKLKQTSYLGKSEEVRKALSDIHDNNN